MPTLIGIVLGLLAWFVLRCLIMAMMTVIAVVATILGAAYAVQPAYGIGFSKSLYLWIPVVGNILAVIFSLLMWGVAFQGYNAIYTSFFPELFPTRIRVTASGSMARPSAPGGRRLITPQMPHMV